MTLENAETILSQGYENSWNVVTAHQFMNWEHSCQRVAHVQSIYKQISSAQCRSRKLDSFLWADTSLRLFCIPFHDLGLPH